ncbi:hypothetical protein [Solwaraspora sp. WMMA2065]|nr:hypothetical protein [Solwaraspora sp. WMMA2065]WJK33921.1 hypothetical protein O7610_25275 [Solwaraspora sp. WMMA2065]
MASSPRLPAARIAGLLDDPKPVDASAANPALTIDQHHILDRLNVG